MSSKLFKISWLYIFIPEKFCDFFVSPLITSWTRNNNLRIFCLSPSQPCLPPLYLSQKKILSAVHPGSRFGTQEMRSCQEMQPQMKVRTGSNLPTAPTRPCDNSSKCFFNIFFKNYTFVSVLCFDSVSTRPLLFLQLYLLIIIIFFLWILSIPVAHWEMLKLLDCRIIGS